MRSEDAYNIILESIQNSFLKPVLKLRNLRFADNDLLRNRDFQIDDQPPVEPQADIRNGFLCDQILTVYSEEITRIKQFHQLVQRLRKDICICMPVNRLDNSVTDIEKQNVVYRYGNQFVSFLYK